MKIAYSKSAVKALQRMDTPTRLRIKTAVEKLAEDPTKGDIKPMQGTFAGLYRLRVGGYRVIYHITADGNAQILFVDEIGARGDIYK